MKKKEENKMMVNNIKAKMFRGYHQVIKNKKKERKLEKLKSEELNLKNLIYLFKSKRKSNKEYLPFEIDYDFSYKNKYTNKLDDIQTDDLQIINLTKKNKSNKNMFLTQTKSKNVSTNTNPNNNIIEKENKKHIFEKLFPDKKEVYKYSELPFFSLTKNPNNFGYNSNEIINLKENDDKFDRDDFLYKLSHNRDNSEKYITNNFNKNKGVKKGMTIMTWNNNYKINKKKENLMLDIENLNNNKHVYLTSKEKRYKILEKEIEPLKNIITFLKDFETEIEKDEIKPEGNPDQNKLEKKTQINDEDINNQKKKDMVITHNELEEVASRTAFNPHPFKKPKIYPVNYYNSKQLTYKEKRFEDKHRIGVEEFQKKINLKTNDNTLQKLYKKKYVMDEYEKQLFKKLISKSKISLKEGYLRNCRINDIILVSKLKCEFSPKDVKRVVNGIKPWNDCQKFDQKFFEKNLPSKVEGLKIIKFE